MEADNNAKRVAIIEAAGAIFVENGFRTTTVRQICARAGVNIAAINYYFGDKKSYTWKFSATIRMPPLKSIRLHWGSKKATHPNKK
jgi:AcrR family transcriptional regulator